jgi:hypothetical protein
LSNGEREEEEQKCSHELGQKGNRVISRDVTQEAHGYGGRARLRAKTRLHGELREATDYAVLEEADLLREELTLKI